MQSSAEPFRKWPARSMKVDLISLTVALACVIGVPFSAAIQPGVDLMSLSAARLPIESQLSGFDGAIDWINSPPLDVSALRGKVVLIDFWTYTCINWRRTLPYVSAWADKYKDLGVVVVGVHTPEFSFEKNLDNVRHETAMLAVHYPVAVDSGYAIWRAFRNQYWPALYIADAQGRIRFHHFGEGGYEESERVIQQLLKEAGRTNVPQELVSDDPQGVERAADWATLKSPESYLGYEQAESFASPGDAIRDRSHLYTAPARLTLNQWALVGDWTMAAEYAALNRPGGRIAYRFHARDVNLIMGPAVRGSPVKFRVRIDGAAPGSAHGIDVDEKGDGTLSEPRMYQLIREPGSIADRSFEIEFMDAGVQAFDFTFG